jgi:hypothetical protein
VALPAMRLVARAVVLAATPLAGLAAYADLRRGAGWRALLVAAWPFLLPPLLGRLVRFTVRLRLRRLLARQASQS